jgi:hypothetical protein
VDRSRLEERLGREFDGSQRQARIVARQARDLADSGQLAAELDVELTVETVVSNLADAPEDCSLAERWNWWMDALTLSHGDYRRFRVRQDLIDGEN